MGRIVVFAVVSAGAAALVNGSVADPLSWFMVIAGVACGDYLAGHPKPSIGIEG